VAVGVVTITAVTTIGACTSGGKHAAASTGAVEGADKPAVGAPNVPDAAGRLTPLTASGNGGVARAPEVTAYKIRVADMTVTVAKAADVATKADAAGVIAARYGGEVYGDERTSGSSASAVVTLKVPPADLAKVLRDLAKLGHETSRSESTKDVTGAVIDVDKRVAALSALIDTLRSLIKPGQKLSDLINLEQQISERQAELESLQAQQRALHEQTDTATVTLTLVTKNAPVRHHHKAGGFLGGLRRGWDAFVHGAGAVALGLGAAVPFAVLVLLLALALRLLWPRLARRTVPAPAPPAPAGD
jgi:hypothetical protein